jgi:uncharacterized repeat protein (TIGR02543 family)
MGCICGPGKSPNRFPIGKGISVFTSAKSGYTFAGWYADAALNVPVNSVTLTGNVPVYAKWTPAETGSFTPPKIGDDSTSLWIMLLLVSAGVFIVPGTAVYMRKKRNDV